MIGLPPPVVPNGQCPPPGAPLYPGAPMGQPQSIRLLPQQIQPHPSQLMIPHGTSIAPIPSTSVTTLQTSILADSSQMSHLNHSNTQFLPPSPYFVVPSFSQTYFDDSAPLADPFVPPSYAPEMKNAVVLQPL